MENNLIKVLIIDDCEGDIRLMKEFLVNAPANIQRFSVAGATALSSALELLETERYDVILLDLTLPDSSGLATFSAVYECAPDVPVVVLTGVEDELDVAVVAVRMGAQDYLIKKTVNAEILSRAIIYSIARKGIEASLRSSEERYRTLVDALDDAIVVLDREFRVLMSNGAFKKAVWTEPNGELSALVQVLSEQSLETCRHAFQEGKIATFETPCRWNKRQSILEVKCIPVPVGPKAQRIIIMARDITAHKQVEQLKDDFASLVSHELRSPLTSVLAGLIMVLESAGGRLEETEKELLSRAYGEAQRLERLISKILEMSRFEADASGFERIRADVVKLAAEVMARMLPSAEGRGIELVGRYSADKIEAFIDVDSITEVFTNMLSNALKFTEQGRIEVGVSEKENLVECYVKDSGIGISREDQTKLFERFKHFGKPVVESEKGTGLGLFMAKEILRRHSGTLSVASEPGKGTTFSFTLPKRCEEKVAGAPEVSGF